MAKAKPQTQELTNVITKKERTSFIKKFTPSEIEEKTMYLSGLLMQKFELENLIEESKTKIKNKSQEIKSIKEDLTAGGVNTWDECEVKIYRDTMKKEFYFEGELVDTEEADESDLQLEIDEQEEIED